ncbi:lipopolysaccharide biosynthesis protein [Flavobacterium sp. LB2R40]|uniref:lipopolysaccharide biosynthesis protein n=1 Tax=unclassified Flavobacterium TaxID=196869 RepID=UPI003AABB1C9
MLNLIRGLFSDNSDSSQRTQSIKKEIAYSFLVKIVSVVTGLLSVPLIIDFLDKERYGIWLTLSSVFAWLSFFDVGIGNGLRNKLTEALAVNDKKLAQEYVSTTFVMVSLIFGALIILFQIINPFIDWQSILKIDTISSNELYVFTSLILTLFLLRFIFQLIGVVYIANQKPSMNNIIVTLGNFLSFLFILLLYYISNSGSLLLLGVVLTGIPLLVLIFANILAFNGSYNFLRPRWNSIKMEHTKILLNLGVKFFLIQIAAILLFSTANIITIRIFNPSEVVVFSSSLMYFQLPIMVYGIIMAPIWSAVTDAYVKKDTHWLKYTLKKLNKISLLFAIGIILMTVISPLVYQVWLGDRVKIPFIVTLSMAIFSMVNVFLAPYTNFINGIGKMKLSTYLVIITFVVYVPLAVFLAKMFDSVAGIMFATCLLNITGLYFQPKQVHKILNNNANGIWNE